MISRLIETAIKDKFTQNKVVLLLGARQVGKTTLLKAVADEYTHDLLWLNGDEADIRAIFREATTTGLKRILGSKKYILIDEAQRIENIGLALKLIVDNFPGVHLIATGSSSWELSSQINEPFTGRKHEFLLFPISFDEMCRHTSFLEEKRLLEQRLLYGYYPDVINGQGEEKEILMTLSESYLYKDLFSLEKIRKPALLEKLLQALALQLGSEVNYHELGQIIGADNQTVEKYLDLLEKAFVIFRLPSLSRDMRNEIKKGRKIYFYDNGIRNAIIKNFSPLDLRADTGALWENFLMSERRKNNSYNKIYYNGFFWRTHAQQEIDYIEERDGLLYAYEFKWSSPKKARFPQSFREHYPHSHYSVIHPENFIEFICS